MPELLPVTCRAGCRALHKWQCRNGDLLPRAEAPRELPRPQHQHPGQWGQAGLDYPDVAGHSGCRALCPAPDPSQAAWLTQPGVSPGEAPRTPTAHQDTSPDGNLEDQDGTKDQAGMGWAAQSHRTRPWIPPPQPAPAMLDACPDTVGARAGISPWQYEAATCGSALQSPPAWPEEKLE